MLSSLVQILIGASATVAYLSTWNWILQATAEDQAAGDAGRARRLRQRRRLAQLVLFLLLTPYVLAVFRLMDWVLVAMTPETTA